MINKNIGVFKELVFYLAIIISTTLAFYPIIHNGYNIDDDLVTQNHKYTSLGWGGIKDIWTNSYYSDEMGYDYGYRPVVLTSFAIEHAFFGESPKVGHILQLILYVILNLSLFVLLRKVFSKIPWYWLLTVVLLFAVHPIHSEVVVSLKNRDELLALLFGVLSMLVLFKLGVKHYYRGVILSALLFLLALWSKKSVLPLLAMWFVVYPHFKALSNSKRFLGLQLFFAIIIWGIVDLHPSYWLLFLLIWTGINYLIHYDVRIKGKVLDLKSLIVYLPPILVGLVAVFFQDAFLWFLTVATALFMLPKERLSFLLVSVAVAIGVIYFDLHSFLMLLPFWAWWNKKEFRWDWKMLGVVFVIASLLWLFLNEGHIQIRMLIVVALLIFSPFRLNIRLIAVASLLVIMSIIDGIELHDLEVLAFFLPVLFVVLQPKLKSAKWLPLLMLVFLAIPFASFYWTSLANIQVGTQALLADGGEFLDSRQLEFVENPLSFNYHWYYNGAMSAQSIVHYTKLLFFPYPLSFYYGYDMLPLYSLFSLYGALYLAAAILILFSGWRLVTAWKKEDYKEWYYFTLTGYLILVTSFAMFSNAIVLVAGIVGERLIFVGSLGFVMILVSLAAYLSDKFSALKYVFFSLFFLAGIAMVVWDQKRSKMWKNRPALMQRDIVYLERSSQAHNLYALALMHYSVSTEKNPEMRLAQQQAAITHFRKAVDIDPTFFNAAFDMGRALLAIGDMQGALDAFIYSITINQTNYLEPYKQVCYIYFTKGLYHEAAKWAQEAKKIDPYGTEWDYYIQQSIGR